MLGTQNLLAFLFLGVRSWQRAPCCLVLAWFGAAMSRRLRENPAAGSRLTRVSDAMFVGLGVKLELTKW